MPPRVDRASGAGCIVSVAIVFVICAALFQWTGSWFWLLVGVVLAFIGVALARSQFAAWRTLRDARRLLESRGVRFLVVYSNSPNWQDYVEQHWLPRLGAEAVTLNWSNRATWDDSIEVRLFKTFIKAWRNYNPAVLVLRGAQRPLVFRFYYAFKYQRGGRPQYLEELERELFQHAQR